MNAYESLPFQALVPERKAVPFPDQDLDPVALTIAEYEDRHRH
nr:hypothetical protein [Marinobacter sp.]